MTFDPDDLHLLALCAWREARGDGPVGMEAVMHVCVNRVGAPSFSATLHDVIYAKNQFTSMSVPSDPEFNLEPAITDTAFLYATSCAHSVLAGQRPDTTGGAHFYYNPLTARSPWFEVQIVQDVVNHPFTCRIGRQNFYK